MGKTFSEFVMPFEMKHSAWDNIKDVYNILGNVEYVFIFGRFERK